MREQEEARAGGGRVMKLFKRAAQLDQGEYDEKVAAGLDRAFKGAGTRDVQLSQLRLVILSDLHRGARDGADDFQRCEPAYSAALGWYLERGYQLYLLGDVEELWENDIGEVLPRYTDVRGAREGVHGRPRADALLRQPRHRLARRRQGQDPPRPAAARHRGARGPQAQGPRRRHAARRCSSWSTATRGPTSAIAARGSRASSCAGSGARSRTAWAGCRPRRPATTTCAPSTTSRCSAGAGARRSPRRPTSARR